MAILNIPAKNTGDSFSAAEFNQIIDAINNTPAGQDGKNIELQSNTTHIQWRIEGDTVWKDLLTLESIRGPQGPKGSDGTGSSYNGDPTIIIQNTTHRFVSDTEKTTWNNKADSGHTHSNTQITGLGTASTKNTPSTGNATATEVVLGNDSRLSDSRTPTTHNHNASQITEDATHRFVTDTEKSNWNTKIDSIGSPSIVSKMWLGTQAQYDALGIKDSATLYFIK